MVDEPKGQSGPPKPSGEQSPWAVAGLGGQFFAALLVFGYAGNWMDTRFNTAPLFVLAGVLGGGGGTFFLSYRRLMRAADSASGHSPHRKNETPKS